MEQEQHPEGSGLSRSRFPVAPGAARCQPSPRGEIWHRREPLVLSRRCHMRENGGEERERLSLPLKSEKKPKQNKKIGGEKKKKSAPNPSHYHGHCSMKHKPSLPRHTKAGPGNECSERAGARRWLRGNKGAPRAALSCIACCICDGNQR